MSKCPVCDTEYIEGQVETCSTCGWNLAISSGADNQFSEGVESISEVQKLAVDWAREMWKQTLSPISESLESHLERQPASSINSRQLQIQLEQYYQQLQQFQLHLEESTQQREQLQSQLEQLKQEYSQLGEQIKQISQERSPTQANDVLLNQLSILISPLEKRLDDIEQYLRAKFQDNFPDSNVTPSAQKTPSVFPNPETPKNQYPPISTDIHLNLVEAQLVATYNKTPDSFSKKASEVSETEESISQRTQSALIEATRRGNYWIITAGDFNYLVPKANIKINQYNYKTLEKLFKCYGYELEKSSDFLLLKPAEVSPMSVEKKWQLVEPGVLQFISQSDNHKPTQQESLIISEETITSENQLLQESSNLFHNNQKSQNEPTLNQIEELSATENKLIPENQLRQIPTEIYLNPQEADLVRTYNKNPGSFSKKATEVSETEQSINQRRIGNTQQAILEPRRWGNYWIIHEGDLDYLVPRNNLKLNESNYKQIKTLFECYEYKPGLSSKFQLIKPAKISFVSGKKWQILELGVLQFSLELPK